MRVRHSARSDVGLRREVNQDYHGATQGEFGTLLVVCDGMGGHAAGEVASRIGVETILATFQPEADPPTTLRVAFVTANERIYNDGRGSMGTTGVAALLRRNVVHIANVGDSRAYLVREGRIQQLSHDHSFVSDQVAAGLMTAEQARHSNVRNIITRALGHQPSVEVDLFVRGLRPGDTIVLSSDGMHGLIEDTEIAEITSMLPPDQAAQRLVDTANERGGIDNITVVIAQVDEIDPPLPGETAITEPLEAPSDDDDLAGPTPSAAAPAPSAAVERPLSRVGLLLSALTLIALIGIGGFLLVTDQRSSTVTPMPAPSVAPRTDTAVTATLAPSASPSALPSASSSVAPSASPAATRPTSATPTP